MYRHIKNYEIRYMDTDAFDNIKLSALLGILQESSCLSADELGFGYDDIKGDNMGFILANWYVELARPVKIGEVLEVHTWPLKPKHLIFLRDFELYCKGEKIGVASARWCMVNLNDFSFMPIEKYFAEGFFNGYNTERSVEFNSWKIPAINSFADGDKAEVYSRVLKFSDYDHYFHVNNTKYADFLTDVFSVEEMRGRFIKKVQITYVKQCKENEILQLYRHGSDNSSYYVEGSVDGETRIQMRVEFGDL